MSVLSDVLTTVSAGSAAVAAIAAFITVCRDRRYRIKEDKLRQLARSEERKIRQQEIEDGRPTFMIDLSRVRSTTTQDSFVLPLTNYGRRRANGCQFVLKILDEDEREISSTEENITKQTIFPQASLDCIPAKPVPSTEKVYTVVCAVKYRDGLLNEPFCDFLVRNWPKASDRQSGAVLTLPLQDKYDRIRAKYSDELKSYVDCRSQF